MNKKFTIVCATIAALTLVTSQVAVWASQAPIAARLVISGAVIDAESRAPIEGVHVVAGAERVVTDAAGRFTVTRPAVAGHSLGRCRW